MIVEPVRPEWFADWLRLRDAVYTGLDRAFHEQEMARIDAEDGMTCFLLIDDAGGVCGMVEATLRNVVDGCLSSPVGYIEGIYVDAAYRGRGGSRLLMQAAEQWCRAQGCREIATDAELDNFQAQAFHERMGFRETYRIVEYRKNL